MKRSSKRVKGFGVKIASVQRTALKFGAALSALAAGGGLVMLTRQSFKTVDAISKTAAKLGLATDRLVGLRHAARLSGVATNKLQMGLQRMTRRIAEAAQGTGEARGALKELGLDAGRLVALSPDQQFAKIGDAMEKVGLQSDRVRLGFKLFDAEGVDLINTLRGGSRALEAAYKDARKLGLAFGGIDAAKIEMANDSFARMRGLFEGVFRSLAIQVAPILNAVINDFIDARVEGKSMGDVVLNATEKIAKGFGKIGDMVENMQYNFLLAQRAAMKFAKFVIKTNEAIGRTTGMMVSTFALATGQPALQAIAPSRSAINKRALDNLTLAIANADKKMKEMAEQSPASERIAKWFEKIRTETDKAATNIDRMRRNTTGFFNALPGPSAKPAEPPTIGARQIAMSRISVEALRQGKKQVQKVEDTQLKQTNMLLKEVKTAVAGIQIAALVGAG